MRLPKIDGLEVLSDIKGCEETRSIPVIILSTSVAENDIRKAYQKFANSYLVKPAGFAKLVDLLRHIKEYWLDCNRRLH